MQIPHCNGYQDTNPSQSGAPADSAAISSLVHARFKLAALWPWLLGFINVLFLLLFLLWLFSKPWLIIIAAVGLVILFNR